MRRKIDVTAAEMLELRKQGLSNHDIAASLDISVQTVRRYIGVQDGHIEGLAAFKDAPVRNEKKEVKPIIPKYAPKPHREWFSIGEINFELNACAGMIGIEINGNLMILPYKTVPDLVQFLAWAMRERMEVSADAQADEVRESEGEAERRDI